MKPGHTYALRLRARDAAGNWSPGWRARPFALVLSRTTEPDPRAVGGWTRYDRSSMSGGTSLYSPHPERRRSRVRSPGRAIALVGSKSPARGKAKVYIDGVLVATVDFRRSSRGPPPGRVHPLLGDGRPHTLKVVVLGTSGRPRVDVDAFVIVP